ncbi:hypothetical protein AAGG91_003005 [Salmonella enterica]|nr:hypothetical protein [Salmonella enterica]MCP0435729.1 hypothetical protein [Salmonella enterica subsp. enterica serovar Mbandaka]
MTSIQRIKGANGVIIDSNAYLELPKAQTKSTQDAIRSGMIRYNKGWKAFEGVIDFDDGTVAYRRFANLDDNGRLLVSQLPESVTSGMVYKGTFDPIQDDIDPPFTYAALPAPASSLSGQYFIVRSIQDYASKHLAENPTTAPFVIFTQTNAGGNWIQIKYYIGKDPSTGTNTVVTYAFARFITASIPSTGHAGILALANGDVNLTTAFNNNNDPSAELALSDSDWVIYTSTSIQRLRQSRVSIMASSVSFDSTVMRSVKRPFITNSASTQAVIDNMIIYGLRRTGDSMTNDGSVGSGRLGITYGTATAPSIAFNDGNSDPDLNSGMIPSEWTDSKTGIFRQAAGSIGFSSNGTEKVRINDIGLTILEATNVNPSNNPAFQFQGAGNTSNPGITGINDTITFSVKSKNQVEFKDSLSLFHGAVNIDGTITIGGDLVVEKNTNLKGNVIIGTNASNTLTINSVSTFQANTTFNGTSNRLKNISLMNAGTFTFENNTSPTVITQTETVLNINPTNKADVTINDGDTVRTKFNQYGVKLPILNPVDNAVGEDGMIAYSTQRNTVMQKSNGAWTTVSGGGVEQAFTTSTWVENGNYYTITVHNANIQSIQVQELNGSNYSQVEVDSISIGTASATVSIPRTPDWRFEGRLIITYR